MKKILSVLMLFAFVLVSYSQCSNSEPIAHFSMTYGIENTLSGDFSIVSENNIRYGVGAIALIDNSTKTQFLENVGDVTYKRFEWGLYGVLGYQFDDFIVGATVGNIFIRPNEAKLNGEKYELPNDTELLYGGFVGYRLSKRLSINCGYNNLSNLNIGLGVGI
jgi:hypothetical protein